MSALSDRSPERLVVLESWVHRLLHRPASAVTYAQKKSTPGTSTSLDRQSMHLESSRHTLPEPTEPKSESSTSGSRSHKTDSNLSDKGDKLVASASAEQLGEGDTATLRAENTVDSDVTKEITPVMKRDGNSNHEHTSSSEDITNSHKVCCFGMSVSSR